MTFRCKAYEGRDEKGVLHFTYAPPTWPSLRERIFKCKACGKDNDRDHRDLVIEVEALESAGGATTAPRYFINCDGCGRPYILTKRKP